MASKKVLGGVALAALGMAFSGSAFAQDTASGIRGTISGDDGLAIAGANVTITHTPSGTVNTVTTNQGGAFFATGLRVGGPYSLSVAAPGYEQGAVDGLYLDAGEIEPFRATLETQLEGGIVVVGVQTRLSLNNGTGSAYTAADISNQPGQARDVIRTLLRDPLAQSSGTGNLSVGGVNPRFNNLSIDGSLQKDDLGLAANTYATERSPINLDAVESASLVASDYSVTAAGFTGGLVNVVTKSGTNEFNGSMFYYYADNDFYGDEAFDKTVTFAPFEEKEYGITLGGPIIPDRLFFFGSYDKFESASAVDFSSSDATNGIQPGFFDALNDLVETKYGIDMGGRPTSASLPVTTERYLAKIDWNISDAHRASFTYQNVEEMGTSVSSGSFVSAWYDIPVTLTAYTGQLFSDWTDNFSTTLRVNYKEFDKGQICKAGTDQPELEFILQQNDVTGTALDGLLTSGTSDRTFVGGCDRFRHGNEYNDSRLQVFASGDYAIGDHVITFGGEYQDFTLYNLFVERSNGRFRFNSVANINAGLGIIEYINDVSNDKSKAASDWGYQTWIGFIQDSWQLAPNFALDYGLRYEVYSSEDETPADAAVAAAYGYNPVNSVDGLDLLMPRLSFRWDVTDRAKITAGAGLFSGGTPNVWLSNAYQPGVVSTSLGTSSAPTAIPLDLSVPQVLLDNVTAGTPRIIDTIDQDFEIPSDWKASVRWDQEFDLKFGGFDLGENYTFGAQVLYTRSRNGFNWRNLAQTVLPTSLPYGTAPDGRRIYADLDAQKVLNLTELTNGYGGESVVWSLQLAKAYDFGFDFTASYAHQEVDAISEGTSSRGVSSWRGITAVDRNFPDARTSPFQVEHAFKLNLGYEHDFIADLTTRVDLFGQFSSGAPFTYTFDITNTNSLFGRAGNGESPFDNNPLYIPKEGGDPLVVYGANFNQAAFFEYLKIHEVPTGRIHEVNSAHAAWNQQWDFRFQQELPGLWGAKNFVGDNRLKFVVDIQNFANLLNKEWGTNYNGPGNNQLPIVGADLVSAANPAGPALTGDAARTACATQGACVYRYNTFFNRSIDTASNPQSVYRIRIGLRYEF